MRVKLSFSSYTIYIYILYMVGGGGVGIDRVGGSRVGKYRVGGSRSCIFRFRGKSVGK